MTGVDLNQGFPNLPAPLVDEKGYVTPAWRYFFVNMWQRTGASQGIVDLQPSLDLIGNTPGDMIYRGVSAWLALPPAAQYTVLRMGALLQSWSLLDGNSFSSQSAAKFFASPTGSSGQPSFRSIAASDLPPVPSTISLGVVAAGTIQGDATALTAEWNEIITVAANTGVIASNAVAGFALSVFNRGANTLNIYPAVGSQINSLAVNTPITLAANGSIELFPVSATQLYSMKGA